MLRSIYCRIPFPPYPYLINTSNAHYLWLTFPETLDVYFTGISTFLINYARRQRITSVINKVKVTVIKGGYTFSLSIDTCIINHIAENSFILLVLLNLDQRSILFILLLFSKSDLTWFNMSRFSPCMTIYCVQYIAINSPVNWGLVSFV